MREIKCQTGAFMTMWRETRAITIPHRTTRIKPRTGHRQRAKIPPAYAITGVLETVANVMTVDARIPTTAGVRFLLSFHQRAKKRGKIMAP